MEEEFDDISEDILARAKKATEDLLPTKSRAIYDKEFKIFVDWKLRNAVKVVNETVMMAYFQELVCYCFTNDFDMKLLILFLRFSLKNIFPARCGQNILF